ncbi:MAG: hypothetical protein GEV07_15590 [Streptosporangiales bacterium]|nr:hypothetical protein [Streptosporangiales bacterium]
MDLCAVAVRGGRRSEVAQQLIPLGGWRLPDPEAVAVAADTELIFLSPPVGSTHVRAIVHDTGCAAGLSAELPLDGAAEALRQAHAAARFARPGVATCYADTADPLLRRLLTTAEAGDLARQVAAGLVTEQDGKALLADAATWLRHHGRWDPAADELGVHRETLRRRMHRVARLTGLELDSADGRLALSVAVGVLMRPGAWPS